LCRKPCVLFSRCREKDPKTWPRKGGGRSRMRAAPFPSYDTRTPALNREPNVSKNTGFVGSLDPPPPPPPGATAGSLPDRFSIEPKISTDRSPLPPGRGISYDIARLK